MARNSLIKKNGGRCPDCGGEFKRDLKGRGFRQHKRKLPKIDRVTGKPVKVRGKIVYCGGTKNSWDKGNHD